MKIVYPFRILLVLVTCFCSLFSASLWAAPSTPSNLQAQANSERVWVLIHADVAFLIPSYRASGEGSAAITWATVTGATYYQYRLFVNGQWTAWVTLGAQSFANINNAGSGDVAFEVIACDASGCSSTCDANGCNSPPASITIVVSMWKNDGLCDPLTGMQKQKCVDGRYCSLGSTRDLAGVCNQSVVPCS